jgi:hypothetical protein
MGGEGEGMAAATDVVDDAGQRVEGRGSKEGGGICSMFISLLLGRRSCNVLSRRNGQAAGQNGVQKVTGLLPPQGKRRAAGDVHSRVIMDEKKRAAQAGIDRSEAD